MCTSSRRRIMDEVSEVSEVSAIRQPVFSFRSQCVQNPDNLPEVSGTSLLIGFDLSEVSGCNHPVRSAGRFSAADQSPDHLSPVLGRLRVFGMSEHVSGGFSFGTITRTP